MDIAADVMPKRRLGRLVARNRHGARFLRWIAGELGIVGDVRFSTSGKQTRGELGKILFDFRVDWGDRLGDYGVRGVAAGGGVARSSFIRRRCVFGRGVVGMDFKDRNDVYRARLELFW